METISKECEKLKADYDACFNVWFCEQFLKGKCNDSMCAPMFKAYRECVKQAMNERSIQTKDTESKVASLINTKRPEYPWIFF